MLQRIIALMCLPGLVLGLALWSTTASAYEQYSTNRTSGNCATCHGDFRASNYVSPKDGATWSNLHDVHRNTMLNGDCNACHQAAGRFPVLLGSAVGGNGLQPLSCIGCHGRAEPAANNRVVAAGLRQHHDNRGVTVCRDCHNDSNPRAFTVVGENIKPPFYFTPDTAHPNKPTDPCNAAGAEQRAGTAIGLDNDGDALYDQSDSDCVVAPPAAPDINLAPSALSFGGVTVGASAALTAQVQNLGNAALNVSSISRCAGTSTEFTWSPAAPLNVAAGANATLTISYAPTNTGTDSGCLVLASNDPDEASVQLNVSASGNAVPVPNIGVTPGSIDFATVVVGGSATRTVTIANSGAAPLSVTSIALGAGSSSEFGVSAPATPFSIAAGTSQSVSVSYAPANTGSDNGTLVIGSNDPDTASVSVALAGSGALPGVADINLNPAALDFGTVSVGGRATLTARIENVGSVALSVSGVTLCAGTSSEFSVTAPATPFSIAAGASQTLSVTYVPNAPGSDSGCVAVTSQDPDEPTVQLALSGSGAAPGPVDQVMIWVPKTINPKNKDDTPVRFYANMASVEVASVKCGRGGARPEKLEAGDFNRDGYLDTLARFETKDLRLLCGDQTLSCSGTLASGTPFQGTSNRFKTEGDACKKEEDDKKKEKDKDRERDD